MPPFNYDEYGNLYTHNGKRVDLAGNRQDRQRKLEAMLRESEPPVDDDDTAELTPEEIAEIEDDEPTGKFSLHARADDPGA